ncbi:MAG: bifunctional homocysteine S-methyltransferase/methylenetetrahydrofolate reductase, partial [Proteobacteria bacterium]
MSLFSNGILIFDGAMGTELYDRGFYINRPFEELNLSSPQDVESVHRNYIDAGADVITTNTFSIAGPQLKKFDVEAQQGSLIRAALDCAHRARVGTKVQIALSVGPTGELVEPLGPTSISETRETFQRIAVHAVEDGRFELYSLETFSNLRELEAAIDGIRAIDSHRPLIASLSLHSTQQELLDDFAATVGARTDVDALGLNCAVGPSDLLTSLKRLRALTTKPIICQPNAGSPRHVNGRYFYMTSPDYLGKYAKRFAEAGASGIGGCCGTGPDHIRAVRSAVRMQNSQLVSPSSLKFEVKSAEAKGQARRTLSERIESDVSRKLATGQKIFSIEVLPPKGTDLKKFLSSIDLMMGKNISFVNIPDGARASSRMGSLHLASLLKHNYGENLSVIPHFTTRDRNLIALQSDLIGAYVNGVRDVLLVTGDPPKLGNNKEATAVYDIDAIGLAYLVDCLNRGVSPIGESLGLGTSYGIGVACNPTAINPEVEFSRWKYKV